MAAKRRRRVEDASFAFNFIVGGGHSDSTNAGVGAASPGGAGAGADGGADGAAGAGAGSGSSKRKCSNGNGVGPAGQGAALGTVDDGVHRFGHADRVHAAVTEPATAVRVLTDVAASPWTGDTGVDADTVLRVDWANSAEALLLCHTLPPTPHRVLKLSPAQVALAPCREDVCTRCLRGTAALPLVYHIDTVFPDAELRAARVVTGASLVQFPLLIEPGLAPLSWPLSSDAFMASELHRRVVVSHALPKRLEPLRADFHGFDPEAMVRHASRVVVWMRSAVDGKMQYLDADPSVGLACYRAGHSLYFNPEVSVQTKWLTPLLEDLGMDVGSFGRHPEDLPADIEVFAVRGTHRTPWHFDAQDNFTLQVRGTKRWTVARATAAHPLTNLHPASSSVEALRANRKVHRAYDATECLDDALEDTRTFVLRPGSVMYLPAGWYHKVDAEGADGSLSINFSVSGTRWAELFVRRLVPALWAAGPLWRQPAAAHSLKQARATAAKLLQSLSGSVLPQLTPADLFPDAAFPGVHKPRVSVDDDDVAGDDADGHGDGVVVAAASVVARSPMWVLLVHDGDGSGGGVDGGRKVPVGRFVAALHTGFGVEGFASDVSTEVVVPAALKPTTASLAALPPGVPTTVESLAAKTGVSVERVLPLVRVLVANGYLQLRPQS